MTMTAQGKQTSSFTKQAKPQSGRIAKFGIGRFGRARFGQTTPMNPVAKQTSSFTAQAKP